jgi:thioredoxin reductase
MNQETELLIVGSGPAGMAAAETAASLGIAVTVVDEQAARGGQFLRQPPAGFRLSNWLPGKAYQKAKQMMARSALLHQVDWLTNSTVTGIFPGNSDNTSEPAFRVVIDSEEGSRQCTARTILIASGCYDLPVIFPGWNTPGVMAAGGIQAFIKSQQFVPGQRIVLAGSHPLQLVIAEQIIQAGGEVAAVLFAQSQSRAFELIQHPMTLWRHASKFSQVAGTMARLRKAGVPVKFSQAVVRANGKDQLHSVTVAELDAQGKIRPNLSSEIACDRLGVCFSFLSSSELARQLEAECVWNARRGGWIARHDEWMASTVPGLYLAGEITGVAGSDVAMAEGQLAALGCALALGRLNAATAENQALPIRKALQQLGKFAELLSQLSWPGDDFFDQLMSDESTVCKCEELSAGQLRKLLAENPGTCTASSVKLLSRAGMGLCQGRYCHHALTRLLVQQNGLPEQQVAGFTARFPAKPIRIGHLTDLE